MDDETRQRIEGLERKVKDIENAASQLVDDVALEVLENTALFLALRDYLAKEEILNGGTGEVVFSYLKRESKVKLREFLTIMEDGEPSIAARLARLRSDLWEGDLPEVGD